MLHYSDIFNPDTLNIFTDASIKKIDNETLGCPGAVCVITHNNGHNEYNDILDMAYYIERYATNNSSEIKAISLGITKALQYRHRFKTINLFSDSRICIQGLREWIFNWVNCINNNMMCNSSGEPVANQNTFASIVHTILANDLKINFYHQKGHVSINSKNSVDKAMKVFYDVNRLDIGIELMVILSNYNNFVDKITGDNLEEYTRFHMNKFSKEDTIIRFDMEKFASEKYMELTNANSRGYSYSKKPSSYGFF